MPLDVKQFREFVIRPALKALEPEIPYSEAAERLILGTAIQESGLRYLDQLAPGPGPAHGLFQMERATHDDHVAWLAMKPALALKVDRLLAPSPSRVEQLATNLLYGAAMARIHYWRRTDGALPSDLEGAARVWKRCYNTAAGAGKPEQFVNNYRMHVGAGS
jgi:hypothetical protein